MNGSPDRPRRGRTVPILVVALLVAVGLVLVLTPGFGLDLGLFTNREHPTFAPHSVADKAAIAGRVVDGAGAPLAGVRVRWFAEASHSGGMQGFHEADEGAVTANDGTFRFDGLAPTNGYLQLAESPTREGRSGEFALRAGNAATELRLVAEPIAPARLITGILRAPDGNPLPHVLLVARHGSWWRTWQVTGMTGVDGRFTLVVPTAGADCELSTNDGAALGQVTAGAAPLELVAVRK